MLRRPSARSRPDVLRLGALPRRRLLAAPHVAEILDEAAGADPRVRVDPARRERRHRRRLQRRASPPPTGEFLALARPRRRAPPRRARPRRRGAIDDQPDADYVYTDEDKIDASRSPLGALPTSPTGRPSGCARRCTPATSACSGARWSTRSGLRRRGYDGSQDWDLVLRVTERARQRRPRARGPLPLAHVAGSTAADGEAAKPYALRGRHCAPSQAHCERIGFPATRRRARRATGVYRLRPALREHPLVSIVIPTAGAARQVRGERVDLVDHCVRSVVEPLDLPQLRDRRRGRRRRRRDRRGRRAPGTSAGDRLTGRRYAQPFNFSDKINVGALRSRGEHLLMLNDDMEIVTPDWLERLVMYSSFPGIGAVGGQPAVRRRAAAARRRHDAAAPRRATCSAASPATTTAMPTPCGSPTTTRPSPARA